MNWKKFFHAPIKYMGKLYHKKYHLQYVHARKLFVFDIVLLLGTLLLIASTIFWYTYDPTIEDFVELRIAATDENGTPIDRISSGEPIRYAITYANTSDAIMTRPQLRVVPPTYFQITTITAPNLPYSETSQTFSLPDLSPGDNGSLYIEGVYFGTPDEYEHVSVVLSYIQDGRTALEAANSTIISSLRDAVLQSELTIPSIIRGTGAYPISLTLTNTGELPLQDIIIPDQTDIGSIFWQSTSTIQTLAGGSSTTITGSFSPDISRSVDQITMQLAPSIRIDSNIIPQDTVAADAAVVHPAISVDTPVWGASVAAPGTTMPLSITITNSGDTLLSNIDVQLPLNTNILDAAATRQLHPRSTLNGTTLIIPLSESIASGATLSETIPVQVRRVPSGGTDIRLTITPTITATAPGGTAPIQRSAESTALAIGTSLLGEGHSRYYTNEGDQLGRGPLPPQIGTETKYWALVTLQNTTSRISDPQFVATLGPTVRWTGRSSVSLGNDMVYNTDTNQVSWQWNSLAPGQTLGLYMELAVVPTAADVGTVPLLLENIRYSGFDTYIEQDITRSLANISADLAQDERGRLRGVEVIE